KTCIYSAVVSRRRPVRQQTRRPIGLASLRVVHPVLCWRRLSSAITYLANQSAQSAPLDCGRGPQLWARSMTARFMFEGSKHSESKQEARGHRPRPQLNGCASSRGGEKGNGS